MHGDRTDVVALEEGREADLEGELLENEVAGAEVDQASGGFGGEAIAAAVARSARDFAATPHVGRD
jgi:hypothetical protein